MVGGNIVKFTGTTTADIPPDKVLDAAKGQLDFALVLGDGANGEYFACSSSDVGQAVLMCQRAIHFFMKQIDEVIG